MLYDLVATPPDIFVGWVADCEAVFYRSCTDLFRFTHGLFLFFFQELKNVYGEPQGRKKAQNQMGCPEIE